jgi:hypothetical protein
MIKEQGTKRRKWAAGGGGGGSAPSLFIVLCKIVFAKLLIKLQSMCCSRVCNKLQ